jgi:hypothetical protein
VEQHIPGFSAHARRCKRILKPRAYVVEKGRLCGTPGKLAIVGTERPAAFAPLMAKVGPRRII